MGYRERAPGHAVPAMFKCELLQKGEAARALSRHAAASGMPARVASGSNNRAPIPPACLVVPVRLPAFWVGELCPVGSHKQGELLICTGDTGRGTSGDARCSERGMGGAQPPRQHYIVDTHTPGAGRQASTVLNQSSCSSWPDQNRRFPRAMLATSVLLAGTGSKLRGRGRAGAHPGWIRHPSTPLACAGCAAPVPAPPPGSRQPA